MLSESIVGDAALIMPEASLTRPLPRVEELGRGKLVGRLREAIRRLNPAASFKEYLAVQTAELKP